MEGEVRGELDVDMVWLFGEESFKGGKNGLRGELGESLGDLDGGFVGFGGGCVGDGKGIDNIYGWKK